MLITLLLINAFLYHEAENIYTIICSSLYYLFLYTPIYLYIVSEDVKETFHELILIRIGKKHKNTFKYLKRIFFDSLIFSVVFSGVLAVIMYISDSAKKDLMLFIMIVLFVNLAGTLLEVCIFFCFLFGVEWLLFY